MTDSTRDDLGLAEALLVVKSTVRHLKAALMAYSDRNLASESVMVHAMMCLGRDVTALEEIWRRLEAGEIARSKITPLRIFLNTAGQVDGEDA